MAQPHPLTIVPHQLAITLEVDASGSVTLRQSDPGDPDGRDHLIEIQRENIPAVIAALQVAHDEGANDR